MGIGSSNLCHYTTRMIWNTKNDEKSTLTAYNANIQTAFHWFHSSKAFNNTRNHRTYAQVVKSLDFDHKYDIASNSRTLDPRIVTLNNEKVKPIIVTPSKVSINAKGCTYKVDISRAFRHLRIDPGDIDLLGILHQDLFLDGSLPFGFRLGSGFFERCSDAIRFIMKKHNHNALLNYIDDLIHIGLPSKIHQSYQFLLSLLKDLGLEVSNSKLVPPSTCVTCLGI